MRGRFEQLVLDAERRQRVARRELRFRRELHEPVQPEQLSPRLLLELAPAASASWASSTQEASGYASRKIRVRPWLDPRSVPGSNCSYTVTSAPREESAHAVARPSLPHRRLLLLELPGDLESHWLAGTLR